MKQISNENFESEVLNSEGVLLVDFWATWCGPCRVLSPVLDQIEAECPDVIVCKVNIDENPELATQFNVSGVPTVLIFKNRELKARFTGLKSKKSIIELLE